METGDQLGGHQATVTIVQVNRRSFLAGTAGLGGSLALGFEIASGTPAAQASGGAAEITAWIVIQPDDSIIIRVAKSEMGQGVSTALPMLVAEELECDWSKVRTEFVGPEMNMKRHRVWGDMSTGGSRSVRSSQQALRSAGATAREMLIRAAALQWRVPSSECRAHMSAITHVPSGRSLTFGQVAAAAARMEPPPPPKLKEPNEWRLIGRPQRRLDTIDKVQGKSIYGIDVRLPNMLYAAVVACPVFGGRLRSVDSSKIAGMKGVRRLVELDGAVGIIADDWWKARKGLAALDLIWDEGENGKVTSETIREYLRSGLTATEAGIGRKDGDFAAALAQVDTKLEADYEAPFLAHATMEPQNATAHVRGDQVEVWAPTQNAEAALAAAATAAGVPPSNVTVHTTMLGGGFGRRGLTQDFVSLAVQIAKHADQPVKVLWTREEDMRHDFYRPMAMARMRAGLGAAGVPIAWHVRLAGPSLLAVVPPGHVDKHFQEGFLDDMAYDVPNYLVDYAMRRTPVPVGFWRCVNHTQNCFFKECFIDELAHAAHEDPYQYRRKLLRNHPRADKFRAVLDAVAERAGWGTPPRDGAYRGIALNQVYDTYTAAVIEASVDRELRIHRVISAVDCGKVVNPLTVQMQVESATVFALTAAIYGDITIGNGRVEQANFDDYPMLRLAQMPKIDTLIVPSGGEWSGIGEPPVAVVAPALCNAIFAATGKRVRSLPLRKHDLGTR
jgi:isoquinoline 1-oxidoreductase beta subunit